MAASPTLPDFEELLRRICREGVEKLGRETAKITAEAAAKGMLSSSRVVFLYTDALELSWKRTADQILSELRRWSSDTKLERTALRAIAERQLQSLADEMVEISRVRRAGRGLSNQGMLESAKQRVDALGPDITFRMRQFDIKMDVARSALAPNWKLAVNWVTKHLVEIAIGLIILVIGGALGLNR